MLPCYIHKKSEIVKYLSNAKARGKMLIER